MIRFNTASYYRNQENIVNQAAEAHHLSECGEFTAHVAEYYLNQYTQNQTLYARLKALQNAIKTRPGNT